MKALQCAHHASTLSVDYVLFVTGDRVSITGGVLVHYDDHFLSSYEKCIDDIYESGLKWAYEAESEGDMPLDEIRAAVSKASVPIDFETFMKHYYMWKEMTKDENLPLPPCERNLPKQDAFWNVTKHGSDVKTQACQSMSVPLPVDAPGAKAFDRMQMTIFSDIHKGSQMFTAKDDLSEYPTIGHYRNAGSKRMTFRRSMVEFSKIFLAIANGNGSDESLGGTTVTPQQVRAIPNKSLIRRQTEDVLLPRKETGRSPKRKVLKRLQHPTNNDERMASKRFKTCSGRPVLRVNENNGSLRGAGAEGTCIVCSKKTNWHCIECGTWCCQNKPAPEGADFFRDINTCSGNKGARCHITGVRTCVMVSHPNFMCSGSIGDHEEG